MAKLIELTQPDGAPALINVESITMVITPNANVGAHPNAKSLVYLGAQQLAVTETVAQVKAKL
jgi:hypothetical protein